MDFIKILIVKNLLALREASLVDSIPPAEQKGRGLITTDADKIAPR